MIIIHAITTTKLPMRYSKFIVDAISLRITITIDAMPLHIRYTPITIDAMPLHIFYQMIRIVAIRCCLVAIP